MNLKLIKKKIDHQRLKWADRLMSYALSAELDNVKVVKIIIKIYTLLVQNVYVLSHHKANHHYIPRFLLKKFSISGTGQIYQYTYFKEPYRASILKEAACAPNLYSFKDKETKKQSDFIETQLFALTLEKYASRIINKIIKKDDIDLTNLERSILTSFIAFQYTRTPMFFSHIKHVLEYLNLEKNVSIEEAIKEDFFEKAFFKNYYNINPIDYFKFIQKNKMSLAGTEDLTIKLAISIGNHLSSLFYKYDLRMLGARSPAFLYLSDSPVNIYDISNQRSVGPFLWYLNQDSLIYLPITPNQCLYFIKTTIDIPPYVVGGILEEAIPNSIFQFAYSDRISELIKPAFDVVDNPTTQISK